TLEQFRIAAQVAGEREAPAETGRAVLPAAAAERVAQGQTEFLAAPFVHDIDLAAARIIADVGVVVGASGFGYAPPWSEHHRPARALETHVRDDPVPATRQRIAAPVGLMIQADAEQPAIPAQHPVVGTEDQDGLGFVVGLAKRARLLRIVDLPARRLRVTHPQVADVAEHALPDLGLQ